MLYIYRTILGIGLDAVCPLSYCKVTIYGQATDDVKFLGELVCGMLMKVRNVLLICRTVAKPLTATQGLHFGICIVLSAGNNIPCISCSHHRCWYVSLRFENLHSYNCFGKGVSIVQQDVVVVRVKFLLANALHCRT